MNIIKKIVDYQREQTLLLNNNKKEAEKINLKLTLTIIMVGCLSFIPFIIVSLVVESYKPLFALYVIEFVVLSVLLLLFIKLRRHVRATVLIYVVSVLLVGYAIYSSVFLYPNQICVLVSFILFQLPIVSLDKSGRVNLIVVVYVGIYITFITLYKNPMLIPDEIFNCLLFAIFGMILGELLRHAQLENLEMKRQAIQRGEKDFLSELYSKGATQRMMTEVLDRDAGSSRMHALIGFDIDDFKNINDRYGHSFGDMVIREFSAEMKQEFCERDIVGRVGGDEFAALMMDYESVFAINGKLRRLSGNISKKNFGLLNGERISVSMGVALFPKHGKTYSELFERVDEALYYAKAHGKNTFHIYSATQEMDDSFRLDGRDLKNMLESTTDGIAKYAYVDNLKLLYFNKKLADLAGGATDAILNPNFDPFAYVHPNDLLRIKEALQIALRNKSPIDELFKVRQTDKIYVPVRLRGYFIKELYQGKYPVFYAVYTDLSTMPKRMEEIL